MVDLIRGKVAKILNSRELALNVGQKDGVISGMQFDILDPQLDEIKDPDSGKVIGILNRPKVRVSVSVVAERFSIARTFRTKRVNRGGIGPLFPNRVFGGPARWADEDETLRTNESTWEDLDAARDMIGIGDPAIQVPNSTDSSDVGNAYPVGGLPKGTETAAKSLV